MKLLFEKSKTDLSVILLELDASDSSIKKAYIYGNSQIISQYDGNPFSANKYFYLHDRLGSVRQIIDGEADVVSLYTYNPFGETIEEYGSFDNSFKFTGQYYDSEIGQYYLRARQYDPHLSRFTGRDPILGNFGEPLTLHKYLYCNNNPLNNWDPAGLLYDPYPKNGGYYNLQQTQQVIDNAVWYTRLLGLPGGVPAFGPQPNFWDKNYPLRGRYDYKDLGFSFEIASYGDRLKGSDFGNYIVGYSLYYNFGIVGELLGRAGGQFYASGQEGAKWQGFDQGWEDWGSIFWITKGALDANQKAQEWYRGNVNNLPPPSFNPWGLSTPLDYGVFRLDENRLTYMSQLAFGFWMNEGGL